MTLPMNAWKMVYENCPDINKANFSLGEKILKITKLKQFRDEKDAYIQDLMSFAREQYEVLSAKVSTGQVWPLISPCSCIDNKWLRNEELYNMLEKAFQEDRSNFKNPKALYLYFSSLSRSARSR